MRIGIPKEIAFEERRVAGTPDTVAKLIKAGFSVTVEAGAGLAAGFSDESYTEAGATVESDTRAVWGQDIVLKVAPPTQHKALGVDELQLPKEGALVISFFDPSGQTDRLQLLADRGVSAIAMEAIPRTTKAQSMDALSSMANLAGYRAVIEAANCFERFFTGQVTAAGKVPPAKVVIIGAGVAGLAAIGAARSLGAIVRAFDVRLAAREQVESMGAKFLELSFKEDGTGEGGYANIMSDEFYAAEVALFKEQAKDVDIIITTALIPGKPAPVLLPKSTLDEMKPGSVIVDLAATKGGNCEATIANEKIDYKGVTVLGYTDLPSRMASSASQLYGTNLVHLLKELKGEEALELAPEGDIAGPALVVHEGEVHWPPPRPKPSPTEAKPKEEPTPAVVAKEKPKGSGAMGWVLMGVMAAALLALGRVAPSDFLSHLTVFILSILLGWQVIWNVAAALHTPLMAVTNAISGIIVVGGLLHLSTDTGPATWLAAAAVFLATLNISGGFLVSQRMLTMFRRDN